MVFSISCIIRMVSRKGDDDFLVMGELIVSKLATLPVFEPFCADLVTADVKVPDLSGNAFEVLIFADVNTLLGFYIPGIALIDQVAARNRITGNELGELRQFKQVQADELATEYREAPEEIEVAGNGHTRKVDFEEIGIARAVSGGVYEGVDVIEDVFGAEVGGLARRFVRVEGKV